MTPRTIMCCSPSGATGVVPCRRLTCIPARGPDYAHFLTEPINSCCGNLTPWNRQAEGQHSGVIPDARAKAVEQGLNGMDDGGRRVRRRTLKVVAPPNPTPDRIL